jgi:hypothetical protein
MGDNKHSRNSVNKGGAPGQKKGIGIVNHTELVYLLTINGREIQ